MKARYLTHFSYIGSTFRSSEKIWLKEGKNYPDPESVQGILEIALLKLRSLNYPNLTLSSRTDGGVHALNATAHFDLDRYGSQIYDPNNVTYELNKFFFKSNFPVFVHKCMRVNDNFSARFNAIQRSYLYRFAVLKKQIPQTEEKYSIGSLIPVEEWKRCYFMRKTADFDIEKFKEGAKHFVGYHDFTTFKKTVKDIKYKQNRREIYSIEVRPGTPLVTSFRNGQDSAFDYWEVLIKGRSFVHNQIRRMIGTLASVAIGKLQPEDVKVMLQVPSKHSWHSFIQCSPPDGLYLCNVEYNPQDLIYNPDSTESANAKTESDDIVELESE